jgi:hypothetical protein
MDRWVAATHRVVISCKTELARGFNKLADAEASIVNIQIERDKVYLTSNKTLIYFDYFQANLEHTYQFYF